MDDINPWHVIRARDAFVTAITEVGFMQELTDFAEEVPPPVFPPDEAFSAFPSYGTAPARFTGRWG